MTLQILTHSFRLITQNFGTVMQIALVPWLVVKVALYSFNYAHFGKLIPLPHEAQNPAVISGGYLAGSLLISLATIVVMIWIIVGWHRFILLDERPNGFAPKWYGDRNLGYFGRAILVALTLLVPLALLIALLFAVLGVRAFAFGVTGPNPVAYIFGVFVAGLVISYLSLRVSLVLPAAAIGEPLKIRESWQATAKIGGTIFGVSVVLVLASTTIAVVQQILTGSVLVALASTALLGLLSLFGISVLTTLFGHLIEGRELQS